MMTNDALIALKKHGKSFNFARLFLDKHTGNAAARLYFFCRQIDDIADNPNVNINRIQLLSDAKRAIERNDYNDSLVGDFLRLCDTHRLSPSWGAQLINGAMSDLDEVSIQAENELITYAYLVAGVVGLMMNPILGGCKQSSKFAVDLGIGMQLTNIARDVLEDAKNNRRYIPGAWLDDLSPQVIINPSKHQQDKVESAIKRVLNLAESYYVSGFRGIAMLPRKHHLGITIAGSVYRQIGIKLAQNNYQYLHGRTVIPLVTKARLASKSIIDVYLKPKKHFDQMHMASLHHPIKHFIDLQ